MLAPFKVLPQLRPRVVQHHVLGFISPAVRLSSQAPFLGQEGNQVCMERALSYIKAAVCHHSYPAAPCLETCLGCV